MALTKEKKAEVVSELTDLLSSSKMTVISAYQGTPVKSLQQLRREARENGTKVKVIKNRLVIKAIKSSDTFKDIDTSVLNGMLLYAFNSEDEVAPAQVIANFAKTQPTLQFVGAINSDGMFIGAEDVKILANLPSKVQLRGILAGTVAAPLSGFINVLTGKIGRASCRERG